QEMRHRLKEDDESYPAKWRDYVYWRRTQKNKEYPIYMRRADRPDAREEVMLDLNEMARQAKERGETSLRLADYAVSPDQKLLAYSCDTRGDESYILRVKDLGSDKLLTEEIPGVYYGLEWF